MHDIEEAKRRVFEMQQRASSFLPHEEIKPQPVQNSAQHMQNASQPAQNRAQPEIAPEPQACGINKDEKPDGENSVNEKNSSKEDSGLITMLLMILLTQEGIDNKLLLALLYLLL